MKEVLIIRFLGLAFISALMALAVGCGDDSEPTTQPQEEITYKVSLNGPSTASEDDMGTGFKIVLDRANLTGSSMNVKYTLSGTATAGDDYESPSGSVSIADGDSEVTVEVPFKDDTEVEGDETIIVTLSNNGLGSNVSLSSSNTLTITVSDNDTDNGGNNGGNTGNETCSNDDSMDQDAHACGETPGANQYDDNTVNFSGNREVVTNGIPTHDYRNQIPKIVSNLDNSTKTYEFDNTPEKASSTTSITGSDGTPKWKFGVAKNGVAIDPAPAEPFIFENPNTGEYNWDWVMEPNNNMDVVGLDCAIAHVQPDGLYHYHGNMAIYAEQLSPGISTGTTPSEPVQIGWAADGFPILYMYGPNAAGNAVVKLSSSHMLKSGDRPGNGTTAPCGEYNGKYTNDYEFVNGSGDLDECNGIARDVTLGTGTYSYFYVITEEFPFISRCLVGSPNASFKIGP